MYPNLNAELIRNNKSRSDLADILKISSSTLSDKMTGKSDWKLKECKQIVKELLPGNSLDYLFATDLD